MCWRMLETGTIWAQSRSGLKTVVFYLLGKAGGRDGIAPPTPGFSVLESETTASVTADFGEVQHESALDLCKVRPADSEGSALHNSNRPGAVAQPRRRLRKGPGSQERRGLQEALERGTRWSWTVTTPSVTAAPDGP